MEYLLIFISAIFVNNIVLSQFLGICPFLGVSKKIDTAIGMGGAIAFVLTLATIITWCVQVRARCFRFTVSSDPFVHPCHSRFGTDGGDYPQEGFASSLSGIGYLPASYHNQLCRAGCSHFGYSERLQSASECGLRLLYSSWFCLWRHCLCRHPRAAGFGSHS